MNGVAIIAYMTVWFAISLALLWAGLLDLLLLLDGDVTISAFLRANPTWFFVPICVLQAGIVVMILHLFVLR